MENLPLAATFPCYEVTNAVPNTVPNAVILGTKIRRIYVGPRLVEVQSRSYLLRTKNLLADGGKGANSNSKRHSQGREIVITSNAKTTIMGIKAGMVGALVQNSRRLYGENSDIYGDTASPNRTPAKDIKFSTLLRGAEAISP